MAAEAQSDKAAFLGTEQFPMHCLHITDLLEFEKLPRHDDVKRLGKFIIPAQTDTRTIVFVSHQWTSFQSPDPQNFQFTALKGALRRMLVAVHLTAKMKK